MSLADVPPHKIATVVTSLQMSERPKPAPLPPSPLRLVRWRRPDAGKYRVLFRRVGEPWLWFSRLIMADDELLAIIHHNKIEIYAVTDRNGIEVGLLELDFRLPTHCELSYFGLVPELTGKGLGRWLMAQAQAIAWRPGITRFWVHTCTLDHPSALDFYLRSGFRPYKRQVEIFDDPRITGILAHKAAPHVPLLAEDQHRS